MTASGSHARDAALWTIGHSTRPLDAFLAVLDAHRIELVADVRRFPGSRRLPQYGGDALATALEAHGIGYRWLPALGGRRTAAPDDGEPTAWRHPAFDAYARHVRTEAFAEGLFELLMLAHGQRTAVLCAELLWWRCHRRLIADVAVSLGLSVAHIRDEGPATAHPIAAPARLVDGMLTYTPLARRTAAPLRRVHTHAPRGRPA